MALYYDNESSFIASPGYAAVERVFALRFSDFGDAEWQQLMQIFESLPEWQGEGEHGCACWYGKSESAPFLLASVEPSGLQVSGVLSEAHWAQWSKEFLSKLAVLPTFEA